MDADDWSENVAEQIRWMNHSKVKAMGTQINEFEISPYSPLMRRCVPLQPEEIVRVSKIRNPMNHPSIIFRKSAILAAGNYHSIPGFEDYELWLRLLKKYGQQSLANIPQALVCVRVGSKHLARRRGGIMRCLIKFILMCYKIILSHCHM